ncbi:MAG: hypothetical protein MUP81_02650 [Dehalococcoidia bacterium]|nr:hypothetical protein [Dehalococcoidia bacterium]
MPVRITKLDHKYRVSTPSGVKAKHTTKAKAKKQANLNGSEFMAGVKRGLEAYHRGDVKPWSEVKAELGIEEDCKKEINSSWFHRSPPPYNPPFPLS